MNVPTQQEIETAIKCLRNAMELAESHPYKDGMSADTIKYKLLEGRCGECWRNKGDEQTCWTCYESPASQD